jgi:hypothetical protein
MKKVPKIVLTGGPGGGKTTAADLYRREIGDEIVVIPEAATIIYGGGFPRDDHPKVKMAAQRAIFNLQKGLEETYAHLYPNRHQICDRGCLDGLAYWPGSEDDFFKYVGTTLENELDQYDGVIFFETAAASGLSIEGGNPVRNETNKEAVILDQRLQEIWSRHEHYTFIPNDASFVNKIMSGLLAVQKLTHDILYEQK